MKKLKGVFIFIGGCGVGAALSYFVTKKLVTGKVRSEEEEIREKEVKEIREYYDELLRQGERVTVSFEREKLVGDTSAQNETHEEIEPVKGRKITGYDSFYRKKGIDILDSSNIAIMDPGGPQDDEPEEEDFEDEKTEYDEACEDSDTCGSNNRSRQAFNRGIEIIGESEYEELECFGGRYDKRELKYYTEDEMVCDDEDQILDGYLDLVGSDFIDILEQGDQKVVYVRNNKIATDFRIERINSARFDINGF